MASNKPYDPISLSSREDALLHCANMFENAIVKKILDQDGIRSPGEARELASFFWKMVYQTVIDSDKNLMVAGHTNL